MTQNGGGIFWVRDFFLPKNLAPKAFFLENISVFHGKSELLVQVILHNNSLLFEFKDIT